MNESPLKVVADEYDALSMSVLPAFYRSKVPAWSTTPYQYERPSEPERKAMFSLDTPERRLNIGAVCGAASNNLATIDAESPRAFENQLRRCEKAGITDTWTVRSGRGGGHIHLHLPVAVKPRSFQSDEFEVRAQGQFVLLPPSVHPNGTIYTGNGPAATIINIQSLEQVDWLRLEPAPQKRIPDKAKSLLSGKGHSRYPSRSEVEGSIIVRLFNAGFCLPEILAIFRAYPAAGKFREMDSLDPNEAEGWVSRSLDRAKIWCATDSPARQRARAIQVQAESMSWQGRTGSVDRSVFLAHLNLAHRNGTEIYHAGCRDLAEIAGCGRRTAAKASNRLRLAGLLEVITAASFPYANRYRLAEKTKSDPFLLSSPHGMGQTSSFFLPDAFRQRGLGRCAFEVLTALEGGPMRAKEISSRTGRHVQTIRKSLHKLNAFGYAEKRRGKWNGTAIDKIDLPELARLVGTSGARKRQREQHRGERLRRGITINILKGIPQ